MERHYWKPGMELHEVHEGITLLHIIVTLGSFFTIYVGIFTLHRTLGPLIVGVILLALSFIMGKLISWWERKHNPHLLEIPPKDRDKWKSHACPP